MTSTNLRSISALYPGQPTTRHIPSGSTLVPVTKDEALQKAILEYVDTLSDEDKEAFRSAPHIIERLQEMQRDGKSLIPISLTARVAKVLQCVKTFMGSLSIFIQQHPETSSLVVGGVNCILTVGTLSTCYSYKLELIYHY